MNKETIVYSQAYSATWRIVVYDSYYVWSPKWYYNEGTNAQEIVQNKNMAH